MSTGTIIKAEIQGLRAYAVMAVLLFHVWPQYLPGGYVGVDVFFVISGYLITGLLLKELEGTGGIAMLDFYGRRLRRLLPAATVVLIAAVASLLFLPVVRWAGNVSEIVASALYVENWWLAHQAVDYLQHGEAASPVQHYWSLSVEEQFYIFWPAMLLGMARVAPRLRLSTRSALGACAGLVFALSLAASVILTSEQPARAYFVTHTRLWELALGGLLAIYPVHRYLAASTRRWLCVVGLALITGSLFAFDQATLFPGYAALLPTAGAALVLMLDGDASARWVRATIGSRAAGYIGDLSYSIYLWHWPIVVLFMARAGRGPNLVEGAAIIILTIVLAHLTKIHVEDRFRARASSPRSVFRPFAFGAGCMVLSVAMALGMSQYAQRAIAATLVPAAIAGGASHPGALALSSGAAVPQGVDVLPNVLTANADRADAYNEKCIALYGSDDPLLCRYGSGKATRRVVVVGDSHAIQWLPAFQEIARQRQWELIGITKASCPFADVTVMLGSATFDECRRWSDKTYAKILELKPDLVVVTQSQYDVVGFRRGSAESNLELIAGLQRRWNGLMRAGISVVAIRDTPRMNINVPDCMSKADATLSMCTQSRSVAFGYTDPVLIAMHGAKGAKLIDMSDGICTKASCPPVIGNVLVWMDAHHLTATYARSLAGLLTTRLDGVGELR